MACAFCGLDAIVLSETGLCGWCFGRLEIDAAGVEAHPAEPQALVDCSEIVAVREQWSW